MSDYLYISHAIPIEETIAEMEEIISDTSKSMFVRRVESRHLELFREKNIPKEKSHEILCKEIYDKLRTMI